MYNVSTYVDGKLRDAFLNSLLGQGSTPYIISSDVPDLSCCEPASPYRPGTKIPARCGYKHNLRLVCECIRGCKSSALLLWLPPHRLHSVVASCIKSCWWLAQDLALLAAHLSSWSTAESPLQHGSATGQRRLPYGDASAPPPFRSTFQLGNRSHRNNGNGKST
jgi:hypothetical protein